MNPHHTTGAELQTMREALHLSRDDLADLVGVQARTVKHWENGRSGAPADVVATVQAIDERVTSAARAALALIAEAMQPPGTSTTTGTTTGTSAANSRAAPVPDDVVLTRYRCAADLHRYRPDMRGMPAGAQAAMVARVMLGLQLTTPAGQRPPVVRVVWFEPADFEAWRTAQNLPNSEATRAAWAAQALAAQAIPHRADHPPA